jgi:hypothetical protein
MGVAMDFDFWGSAALYGADQVETQNTKNPGAWARSGLFSTIL